MYRNACAPSIFLLLCALKTNFIVHSIGHREDIDASTLYISCMKSLVCLHSMPMTQVRDESQLVVGLELKWHNVKMHVPMMLRDVGWKIR